MNYFRMIGFGLVFCALSCGKETHEKTLPSQENDQKIEQQQQQIDSLKQQVKNLEKPATEENNEVVETPPNSNITLKNLAGKHALTLQWISWDKPGLIHFKKIGADTYEVKGQQTKGNDFLKIEGTITQKSNTQLDFVGTIETFVERNGAECNRTGSQTFLVTQNRKYWRLQNMTHCFGLTDYVDIYF